ncbi:aminoglycoside phosphotransferase [Halococcus salifodinae DSM 8989]|uniref:Aminoglycoside phosphotransferase n=1 Tax=Halococcus salifodinae DSM 8989 TaxID=1227456 RepID=M0N8Z9_9EURY|nr:aminoglycoside phosphotransferase [Halococcus salifodinae DSM 8989]
MSKDSSEYFERLVDEDALAAYFREEPDEAATLDVERHAEGHSNETLLVV